MKKTFRPIMGVILLQEQELLPEMFCINIVRCFFLSLNEDVNAIKQ